MKSELPMCSRGLKSIIILNNKDVYYDWIIGFSTLDFDIAHDHIYWTDVKVKAISRAFINGSEMEKVVDFGLEIPDSLAIDWISHNIYSSDTSLHRIEVVRLEGRSRKVLIWQNIIEPRCLVLDPQKG